MGNWKRAHLIGKVDPNEVPILRAACDIRSDRYYDRHHILSYNSFKPTLCGLNGWVQEEIDIIGNIGEKDPHIEDIVAKFKDLVRVAPSLKLRMHVGGNYEAKEVTHTIIVYNGEVTVGPPEMKEIKEIPESQMMGNFRTTLRSSGLRLKDDV